RHARYLADRGRPQRHDASRKVEPRQRRRRRG
ncbi:hypothetical protein BN1723_019914, partial [Verticillium longisporum]